MVRFSLPSLKAIALFAIALAMHYPHLQAQEVKASKTWGFELNQGQVPSSYGSDVLFWGRHHKGGTVTVSPSGFNVYLAKEATSTSEFDGKLSTGALEVAQFSYHFIGANRNAKWESATQQAGFANYYLPNCPNGIVGVKSFEKLVAKDIYAGIDLEIEERQEGIKYSFVVHPGADPSIIKVEVTGGNSGKSLLRHNEIDGSTTFKSGPFKLVEHAPVAWTVKNGVQTKVNIESYKAYTQGSRFHLGNYDKSETLIIDPLLNWATYLGGNGADRITGVASDTASFVTVVGTTTSTTDLAISTAFQANFGGNLDAFLGRFDVTGARQWVTYLGGSGIDRGEDVAVDTLGAVYVAGSTFSTGLGTAGVYLQNHSAGSNSDGFAAKFTSAGARTWFTYYGGIGTDVVNGIALDSLLNVVIGGSTTSTTAIATGSSAFDLTQNGNQDAFAAKLTNAGVRIWGTYWGGSNDDDGNGVAVDRRGNVILGGFTSSTGQATTGAQQTSIVGLADGFLVKFTPSGARRFATYYGGNRNDYMYDVATDRSGNLFMVGQTASTNAVFSSGAYQTTLGGGVDGCIIKYDTAGARQFATYYGGTGNDAFFSLVIDEFGNLHLAGYSETSGSTNPIATADAIQTTNAGASDAMYINFSSTGSRIYGTYYGGSSADSALGISRIFRGGRVWLGGTTASTSSIATTGAFQTSLSSGNDGLLVQLKASPCSRAPKPSIVGDTVVCAGATKTYRTTRRPGNTYLWTLTGGTALSSLTTDSVTVRWDTSGSPRIKVVENNSRYCEDSSKRNITIQRLPKPRITGDTSACIGQNIVFTTPQVGTNIFTYRVENGSIVSGGNTNTVTVNFPTLGLGLIVVRERSTLGCADSTRQIVTINAKPTPTLTGKDIVCVNERATYRAKFNLGSTYNWRATGGTLLSAQGKDTMTVRWNSAGLRSLRVSEINAAGCSDSAQIPVRVNPLPTVNAGSNQSICDGDSTTISTPTVAGYAYQWYSSPLSFLSNTPTNRVAPTVSTTYFVEVTDTITTCVSMDSLRITVRPSPIPMAGADRVICENDTTRLGNSPIVGNTYSWTSLPAGFSSSIANPLVRPTDSIIYILAQTNVQGCTRSDSVAVGVNPRPDANAGFGDTICERDTVQLGDPSVSNSGLRFSWFSVPSGFSSILAAPRVTPNVSTLYVLTVTDSITGCRRSDSVSVEVNPSPSPNIGGNPRVCLNTLLYYRPTIDSLSTKLFTVTGATLVRTDDSGALVSFDQVGTVRIKLQETTPAGCTDTTVFVVIVDSAFTFSLGPDSSFCEGDSLNFIVPNGFTDFTFGADTSGGNDVRINGRTLTVFNTATVYLTLRTPTGCQYTDTVQVDVNPLPQPDLGNDSFICQGDFYELSPGTGFSSYLWQDGSTDSTFRATRTGIYSVTVTNAEGCEATDFVTLLVKPKPFIDLGKDTTLCLLGSYIITPGPGFATYVWQDSSMESTYEVDSSGVYSVTVTNQFGCSATDTVVINLNYYGEIFFPNIFSPNDDDLNEVYSVVGLGPTSNFNIRIYNRWGQELVASNDYKFFWDGKFKGTYVQEGVYHYNAKATDCQGREGFYSGNITVVR